MRMTNNQLILQYSYINFYMWLLVRPISNSMDDYKKWSTYFHVCCGITSGRRWFLKTKSRGVSRGFCIWHNISTPRKLTSIPQQERQQVFYFLVMLISMQDNLVNMKLIYVNMQHNYVDMKLIYATMQGILI